MNLLAAAGAPGSPVRKVVLKSSGLVYGANKADPYNFREDMARTGPANTPVERSLLEVEAFVRDFADDNPHVDVSLLRFANVLGVDIDTPFTAALRRPVVPEILGFDPRLQFIHEDDVVDALMYAINNDIPGVYNVGADGVLPWSEVCAIVGKRRVRAAVRVHEPGRGAGPAAAPLGPPARGDGAAALRPLDRQHALQARGLPLRIHDRDDGRGVRAGAAPRGHDRRQQPVRTATNARSRTSSATRPPSSAPTDAGAGGASRRPTRRLYHPGETPNAPTGFRRIVVNDIAP